MKLVPFLRNPLRRKNKESSTKAPFNEQPFLLEVPPASPLLKASFATTIPALSESPDFEFLPEDPQIPIADHLATDEVENRESLHASIAPHLRRKYGSLFQLRSHGPPQNASHVPLNLGGRSLRDETDSQRATRPPSPIPRSPTRVKFAPEPLLQRTLRRTGLQNQGSVSFDDVEVNNQENGGCEDISTSGMSSAASSRNTPAPSPLPDPPGATQVVSQTFIRSRSSSPHLPLQQTRLKTEPQLHGGNINLLQDTLASFPQPPPLKVRRRPQPLVLLPTPTTARLPPSPLASSNDSTPLTTPTMIGSPSSPRSSKFPGRPHHTVTPPRYSPPDSPLPTPPTSSASLTPSDHKRMPRVGKTLRNTQSTSELHESQFEMTYPVHRSRSSAPPSNVDLPVNATKRTNEITPAEKLDYSSLETMKSSDPPHKPSLPETHIQWGYAL